MHYQTKQDLLSAISQAHYSALSYDTIVRLKLAEEGLREKRGSHYRKAAAERERVAQVHADHEMPLDARWIEFTFGPHAYRITNRFDCLWKFHQIISKTPIDALFPKQRKGAA